MKICHITTVHSRYDIRIFWKEAISASKAGFDVTIILNDSYEDEVKNGVKIISIIFHLPLAYVVRLHYTMFKVEGKA